MNDRGRAAARSNLLMSPLVAVAGFAATVAVVRALAPSDFAVYAVVIAFKGIVQFASDFGTGAAATRLFGELQVRGGRTQARRLYARLMGIRLVIAAGLLAGIALFPDAFADLLGLREDEHEIIPLLVAIAVTETLSILGYSVLAGLLRHDWINRAVLASTIVQPAVVIAAAAAGTGITGITVGLLVGSLVRGGGLQFGAVRALRQMEDAGATHSIARGYIRTAAGSIAGKVAAWTHSRQLVTLIAIQSVTRVEVAVFALAYDLVQQVLAALSSPFGSLMLPLQAASVGDEARARRVYRTAVRILAFVLIPAAAVMLALTPPVVEVLFGDAYADVVWFAAIFLPGWALETILSVPVTALMLSDDRVIGAYTRVKAATVAFGVTYFALAGADLLVVAGAMMAIRLASTFALVLVVYRRLGISSGGTWVARLAVVALGGATVAALPWIVLESDVIALAVGVLLALPALAALARRVRLLSAEDADLARSILPQAEPLLRIVTGS